MNENLAGIEEVKAYLEEVQTHNHDNLAEEMMQNVVSDTEEHTQELITAIQIKGLGWINIKMGTLELAFGDTEGEVQWEAEISDGVFESGLLSDVTGFRSLG